MKKKEFKTGDKIKFVGPAIYDGKVWFEDNFVPYIADIKHVGRHQLDITIDGSEKVCRIHPIQVTHRIVKKKRRDYWIEFLEGCSPLVHREYPEFVDHRARLVQVREVLGKK